MNSNSYEIISFVLKDSSGYREQFITDERSFNWLKYAWVEKIKLLKSLRWQYKLNQRELQFMWGYDAVPICDIEIEYALTIAYDVKESQLKKFNLSFADADVYKGFSQKTKEHFQKEPHGDFFNSKNNIQKNERCGTFCFDNSSNKFLLSWAYTTEGVSHINRNLFEKQMSDLGKMNINHFNDKMKVIKNKRAFDEHFLEHDIYNPKTLIGRFEMNKPLLDDGMEDLISPWVSPIYIHKFTAYIRR